MKVILVGLVSGVHEYHIRKLFVIIVHHWRLDDHSVESRLVWDHAPRRICLIVHDVSESRVRVTPLQVLQDLYELVYIMLANILSILKRLFDDLDGMIHVTVLGRNVVFFV